jgi:hypothetical protein
MYALLVGCNIRHTRELIHTYPGTWDHLGLGDQYHVDKCVPLVLYPLANAAQNHAYGGQTYYEWCNTDQYNCLLGVL